jgi:hypothetical protein
MMSSFHEKTEAPSYFFFNPRYPALSFLLTVFAWFGVYVAIGSARSAFLEPGLFKHWYERPMPLGFVLLMAVTFWVQDYRARAKFRDAKDSDNTMEHHK